MYEVKVGRYWVVVSDIGYSHYKGAKRIIKTISTKKKLNFKYYEFR